MSLFNTVTKKFVYALAHEGVGVGSSIKTGKNSVIRAGNSVRLADIPAGAMISNVSLTQGCGGVLSRSAGAYCLVRGHVPGFAFIELMSGEIRLLKTVNSATIGKVSNEHHFLEQSGKAGRSRWLGKRPTTRGVAMNPVDHPNGGGEGKKSGKGRTPWGKPSKQGKTLNHTNNPYIVKRRYE